MYMLMRWENFCCGCFNCNLEAVEAAGFRCPDFGGVKLLLKFSLTTVGGSKECKDVGDAVAFSDG